MASDEQMRSLDQIRQEIDAVDADLVRLLSRRTELAIEVGHRKGRDGQPFFTPERERSVFEKLAASNPGPLETTQLQGIFREIISAARAAEQPLKVSYWGPPGTYSHYAAHIIFGGSSTYVPRDSIEECFRAVEQGLVQYGVVPVENSVAGIVPETLDCFPLTNVRICAERYANIHHCIVSLAPEIKAVQRIYSGPQPARQCRKWLATYCPGIEIVDVAPTARAVEHALRDPEGAAIANRLAAELYDIPILEENIEDDPHNRTRFLVVGFNEPAKTGRDKTSLMFNLKNKPGELYRALGALEQHGVNLQMIESRPAARSSFEYIFFCDCIGHIANENMQLAVQDLKSCTLETVILGSYPAAE
ncbi:MAG: prephenate dehydratase [Fimbriimonadaceae bacterium]|nr:prephenate dehydratase [Fimbriimonadaceae bacterium]